MSHSCLIVWTRLQLLPVLIHTPRLFLSDVWVAGVGPPAPSANSSSPPALFNDRRVFRRGDKHSRRCTLTQHALSGKTNKQHVNVPQYPHVKRTTCSLTCHGTEYRFSVWQFIQKNNFFCCPFVPWKPIPSLKLTSLSHEHNLIRSDVVFIHQSLTSTCC